MKSRIAIVVLFTCLLLATAYCDDDGCEDHGRIKICFGWIHRSEHACSGHGSCVARNLCVCNSGWSGHKCDIPCGAPTPAPAPAPCSEQTCTTPTPAPACNTGFTGENCSVPICFSQAATDSNVCNGRGSCIAPDKCLCQHGFEGDRCDSSCVVPPPACNPGLTGPNCDIPVCFGVQANDQSVCNGHGNCSAPNVCTCQRGWLGLQCDQACSHSCPTGFTGENCNIAVCFSQPATDSNVCFGHGICSGPDTCNCSAGWQGDRCNLPIIPPPASCPTGYGGDTCNIPICFSQLANDINVCNGNGMCIAPDTCKCKDKFEGQRCESQCRQQCPAGFTGQNCNIPICYSLAATECNACSGNGVCIAPDTCNCTNGWEGSKCDVHCQAPPPACNPGLTGPNCDIPICFSIPANNPSVCNGLGKCVAPDTCACVPNVIGTDCKQCLNGYTGTNCTLPICFSQPANDVNVCFGHGVCSGPDTCICTAGWVGDRCNQFNCYGINMLNPSVCSGVGMCVKPDTCMCPYSYTGIQCECKLNMSAITCPVSLNATSNN